MKTSIKYYIYLCVFVSPGLYTQILTPDLIEQIPQLQNFSGGAQPDSLMDQDSQNLSNEDRNRLNIIQEDDDKEEDNPLISISRGELELERFGYDIFKTSQDMFVPATDIPVPDEYIIGAGDSILVQLFGNVNQQYNLLVNREGIINFPEIGPIVVSGTSYSKMKLMLEGRIKESIIGVDSSITLGQIRSIRVFVLGDVETPGSYTVSGLSTMTNALFVSGGITNSGSLRKIQLKRSGEVITELDLYDLLLSGNTSGDSRLLPGDVIFVPSLESSIALDGAFRKPGIYEFDDNDSLKDIIGLVGGVMPNADLSSIKVERILPGYGATITDINLNLDEEANQKVVNGDIIFIATNPQQIEEVISLVGNTYKSGIYQWKEDITLFINKEKITKLSGYRSDITLA